MKLDAIKSLIVSAFAILISMLFFQIVDNPDRSLALSLVFGIPALGTTYDYPRTGVSIKILMISGMIMSYILNFIFSFYEFNYPVFIAVNGIFVLLFILIAISIYRTNQ